MKVLAEPMELGLNKTATGAYQFSTEQHQKGIAIIIVGSGAGLSADSLGAVFGPWPNGPNPKWCCFFPICDTNNKPQVDQAKENNDFSMRE